MAPDTCVSASKSHPGTQIKFRLFGLSLTYVSEVKTAGVMLMGF